MHYLSVETTRWISSSQIITSVSSVVKELVENALDADSRSIHVKLENFGLDLIEVKDDGIGISGENVHKMFLPGYTSKISDFKDLDKLVTYGFRGEALGALCRLGEVCVTTKTDRDTLAMTYTINSEGVPTSSAPSYLPRGTTICVKNLFKALPVRKQFASSKKKMAEELKRVERVVQSLALIHPHLRVVLTHNKNLIWQKNCVNSLKHSFMQIIGIRHTSKMEYLEEIEGDTKVELIVPMKTASDVGALFTSTTSQSFVFVNRRPVSYKEVSKLIEEVAGVFWHKEEKHVLFLASITVSPSEVDVNLEPNKTKIRLKNLSELLALILKCLQQYYGCVLNRPQPQDETKDEIIEDDGDIPCKKPKLDDSYQIEEKEYKKVELETSSETHHEPTSSICSQINKNNCVLASETEVSDLNEKLNANRQTVVTLPTNVIRGEIQENLGGKILPAWPVRQKTPVKSLPMSVSPHDERGRGNVTTPVTETHTELPVIDEPEDLVSTQEYFNKVLSSIEQSKKRPELCVGDWSRGQVSLDNGKLLQGGAAVITPQVGLDNGALLRSSTFDVPSTSNCRSGIFDSVPKHSKHFEVTSNAPADCSREVSPVKIPEEVTAPFWFTTAGDGALNRSEVVEVGSDLADDVRKFDLSIQSVSSQMGKKELSGFTKFARIMRPKIIEENPNILFTEVSRLLVERWHMLASDEKEYYESVAKAVDEERRLHRRQQAVPPPVKPKRKPNVPASKADPPSRPERRQMLVPLTLDRVIEVRSRLTKQEVQKISLIGRVEPSGEWLYHHDLEIGHIRHTALSELVLYHRMMSTYKLTTNKLDRNLHLTASELGQREWNVLTSLLTEYDEQTCRYVVTSPVVVKNGFGVELLKTTAGDVTAAFLTEVAADLENFGVADLKEVLQLYQHNGPSSPMHTLRPDAVKNYIQKEVLRIVETNRDAPGRGEIASLLRTWQQNLTQFPPKCLHDREVFVPIFHPTRLPITSKS